MRGALAFTLAVALVGAHPAAQRPDTPLPPLLAHLDAVVRDAKGRVVADLKTAEVSVVEDGVVEPVDSVVFVRADGRGGSGAAVVPIDSRVDESREAGLDGARLFAIFLDEYHVSKGEEADRARDAVSRFIESLGPRDLAVVIKPLDSIVSFRMTHDKTDLLKSVASFEGRRGDLTARNDFERNYIEAAPARAEAVRSQIVTSALDAMAAHMGSLQPGRKTLIVVSDGFARPPRRQADALPTVESTARDANRRGVSVYAIDPRALTSVAPGADAAEPEHEALRALATQTDGRLGFTAAEATAALAAASADASAYYVVSFKPAHASELRTFHEVELRISRPGVTFHARKGYWAASPEDLMREIDVARSANPTPPPEPMRHVSGLILPWFGVARAAKPGDAPAAGRLMNVNFVWEAVPPVPGDRVTLGHPALVLVRAIKQADGTLVFTGQVKAQGETLAAATKVPSEAAFLAPPGRLILELEIQDGDRHLLDTDVRDVVVGGLAGPVEVGTPEVFRASNAREFRALKSDPASVPVASRDFSRGDHLLIRIPVYGDGAAVTAALVNRAGVAMRELPEIRRPDGNVYETDVNLAGFASGNYAIRIAAKCAAGDAGETVAFNVQN